MYRNQRGFTLIEILVVVLIIGILAGYFGQNVFRQTHDSKTKVSEMAIETRVPQALAAFYSSHGSDAAISNTDLYARGVPRTSPWGRPTGYRLGEQTSTTVKMLFSIFPESETPYESSSKVVRHFLSSPPATLPHQSYLTDISPQFPAIQSIYVDQWGVIVIYRKGALG